jgi:2-polyprenyl-6-methoxyphenol hydroxylase-like FAD-dependent oxidoreductase
VTTLCQKASKVNVVFGDGSSNTYDLVVGADGIHSSLRQMVFGGPRPRHVGQVNWRFVLDYTGPKDTWTVMLGRRRAFLQVPIGPNRLYCYADLATPATEDPTHRELDRFRGLFADFGEPVSSIVGNLDAFDSIHFAPIEEVVTDTWVRKRVALIGDAAHATSPNMADGASMAVEDALVLTRMLMTHKSPDEALSAFTERRRARLNWVRQ